MSGPDTLEMFDSLREDWERLQRSSNSHIFSTFRWSRVWWQQFGTGYSFSPCVINAKGEAIGIAPLCIKDRTARFIGSTDVCDYLDFIVAPGKEDLFSIELIDTLVPAGIKIMELEPIREDSVAFTSLQKIAARDGFKTTCRQIDVSVDMPLPATWEEYLNGLTAKQRHELKRKIRRLNEMGDVNYRTSTVASPEDMELFLDLFRNSREDKADFLTPDMELFFKLVANAMAEEKLLSINFMELDGVSVASTLCFDYRNCIYLYNSGYSPEYRWLSAGLISKALCIKDGISRGKERFDFLKGDEAYKYHLGGQELPLYQCTISLLK
jgi:CelD/BcsL family acetyltransferase involved in cellulose biosynthesis